MHPATGFSVAATLRLAPAVADALAAHLPGDPRGALAAAHAVLWPPAAQAVHLLRRRGLEALLRMPPEEVPAFFEVFFALPGAPPLGLPHRPRRPPGDGRRHERPVRPGRVAAAPAPRRPRPAAGAARERPRPGTLTWAPVRR